MGKWRHGTKMVGLRFIKLGIQMAPEVPIMLHMYMIGTFLKAGLCPSGPRAQWSVGLGMGQHTELAIFNPQKC